MRARPMLWVAALVVGLAFTLLPAAAASAPVPIFHGHDIHHGIIGSSNWSGYAAYPPGTDPLSPTTSGPTAKFTHVQGSWVQPYVNCPGGSQYASFWVGLDGYLQSSTTVEQIGTDSDCYNGQPEYYAWYEFFNEPSYTIYTVPIHPGDSVSASVSTSGEQFTLWLRDNTTGRSYTHTETVTGASYSSAEWVAEAPSEVTWSGQSTLLPLANFNRVFFSGASATMVSSDGKTTTTGPITNSSWQNDNVVMCLAGPDPTTCGPTEALPSSTTPDGSSFSILYTLPPPPPPSHHGHHGGR